MLIIDRVTPTHRRMRLVEGPLETQAFAGLRGLCLLAGLVMLLACGWLLHDLLAPKSGFVSAALLFSLSAAASFIASALIDPVTTQKG
jgi:hypothetical protein